MLQRIAVVDDSSEFQQLIDVMLQYLGIQEIHHWASGLEALPKLLQNPPELLVLDVMMSGMDGLNVWRELRAQPQTHSLPVIICTAAINSIVHQEADLNNDPLTVVLPKPFTLDELRQAIGRVAPLWQVAA